MSDQGSKSNGTTFWSAGTIRELLSEVVPEGVPTRVKHAAYELSLGPEVYVTTDDTKRILEENAQVVIPPGQMALLLTEERVTIPRDVLGFISIKYQHKLRGLINVSGFHVDPGFEGRLVFAVYNAGPKPVPLTRKTPVFIIWFCSLDRETDDPYNGAHRVQDSISDGMVRELHGRVESPAALLARVNTLQDEINRAVSRLEADFEKTRWKAAFIGLFLGSVFSGILVPVASWALAASQDKTLGWPHVAFGVAAGMVLGLVGTTLVRNAFRPRARRAGAGVGTGDGR